MAELFGNLNAIEYDPETQDRPGVRHALAAAEAYNREAERKERLAAELGRPPARRETPWGAHLAQMASSPPEFDRAAQERFLEALVRLPHLELAAFRAGVLLSTVNKLRQESPDFEAVVQTALGIAGGLCEEEAWRRAVQGYEEPIIYQGQITGTKTAYDSSLHQKILEARNPAYQRKQTVDLNANVSVSWLELRQALISRQGSSSSG